ncbi:MAG: MjaI family restriction endonuclease [Candidatus Kryptonium sp.]
MPKEWILNIAMNRWGLNKKDIVGPVSAWIRECSPRSKEDWEKFYINKLSEFLKNKGINLSPAEYLIEIGKKLYVKISEVIRAEIESVTEEDCVNFIYQVIIDRTFEGYQTERTTIYRQLENVLGISIKPAPDEWDRLYNVDFYIEIGSNKFIGLQIKPVTFEHAPEYKIKWKEVYKESHQKFENEFGGKVFTVLSVKEGESRRIYNEEVIEQIKNEIKRLKE